MALLQDAPAAVANTHRRRRVKLVVLLSVALLVVAGGAVAATAVSFRYLHAAPLSTTGGGWRGVDAQHVRHVSVAGITALVVSPRPGHTQVFELDLNNFSDVTQTVIGLTDAKELADPQEKAEPERLRISSTATWPRRGRVHFTAKPVTIPPGGQYRLRFSHDTSRSVWGRGSDCRGTWWEDLSLKVKVGWFTRTETLDFSGLIMEIQQSGKDC